MINTIAANLVALKRKFKQTYVGKSRTPEVIPITPTAQFPIEIRHLDRLHEFARKNPIYYNNYEDTIGDIHCIVYEGDIDRYWLGSVDHKFSAAPFSPTWIMSGYVLSLLVQQFDFAEMIDVGSGDGRISFCAGLVGLRSFGIEIDCTLADLQTTLSELGGFEPHHSDAASFDYSTLNLSSPAFAIGGLAQMGGTNLTTRIVSGHYMWDDVGWVLAGTHSPKYPPDPLNEAGWGTMLIERGLDVLQMIHLPTAWTFHELDETPYILAAKRNPN